MKKITQDERQTTSLQPDEVKWAKLCLYQGPSPKLSPSPHNQGSTQAHCSQCFHAPQPKSILVSSMDRNTTDKHPSLSDFDSQVRRQLERLHQGKAASPEFGGPVPAREPSALWITSSTWIWTMRRNQCCENLLPGSASQEINSIWPSWLSTSSITVMKVLDGLDYNGAQGK